MSERCGKCEYLKKVPFSNVFECTKYGKYLKEKPPIRCNECQYNAQNEEKVKKTKKKDIIEVR